MEKIKVLIVDDSAVTRKLLETLLSGSPSIEVVGGALDPYIAVNKIKKFKPDVLTLDIEMPRMDGITFLSKLMISNPMPVIMVSSLTTSGAKETIKALDLGAVDFICKPVSQNPESLKEFGIDLIDKVIAASGAKIMQKAPRKIKEKQEEILEGLVAKKKEKKFTVTSDTIIAIGASTGGTIVLEEILTALSEDAPGIVITQHMPEKFTYEYAQRVNRLSKIYVKEAEDGDRVYRGTALIAPGGKHIVLKNAGSEYIVRIDDSPPVNRFKPSVDVLFRSVSRTAGSSAVGILCTGMGRDGAQGLLEMKNSGAYTIAQSEASCAVYGMPREAVILGAVMSQMDIKGIIEFISGKNKSSKKNL